MACLLLHALSKAMQLADQFEDMGMVGQAIQKSSCQAFTAKDLDPIGELQIGGDDQGQSFVKFGAEGKECMSAIGRKRDKAEFIQHHQIQLESLGDEAVQAMFILSLEEFVDQAGSCPEAHFVFLAAGRLKPTRYPNEFSLTRGCR